MAFSDKTEIVLSTCFGALNYSFERILCELCESDIDTNIATPHKGRMNMADKTRIKFKDETDLYIGEGQLIRLTFSDGGYIDCTNGQLFYDDDKRQMPARLTKGEYLYNITGKMIMVTDIKTIGFSGLYKVKTNKKYLICAKESETKFWVHN